MATLTDAVALPPRRLHAYEEHYPQKYKRVGHGRFEERFKILGDLVEEISEVDEESSELNSCSSSSANFEDRSPYAIPLEDRIWYRTPRSPTSSFVVHHFVNSSFTRRFVKSHARIERGFNESTMFNRKRSSFLHGERRLGGSFDHLTMDFFHLPPIPEAVPLQFCKPKSPKFEEDETDYDDSSECSDFNSPS
ncbi:unnamed protein product [Enterobius vermicularis]|uniref:Senescence regulator S40 n=1 Tax=Enterobius vermicularis TaxID=51028 RepID=A0A0N4VQP5_ENTVE|nr:unnamed protein product [Enterobius vermicularis]